jgi:NADP-reducing hydrogenase subunit HndD
MFGATIKTWYAEKFGIDPSKIVVVGIMPCTAKKFETMRDDQSASGYPDVDIALTTRELGRMIESAGIFFRHLPDEEFDNPLGDATGAAVIFGTTGGVMEAALRTAVERLTGETLKALDFTDVRGTKGIKEATYNVAGMDIKVCVASGIANAKKVMDKVKDGTSGYHFIEIMGCPGGCVNGGGQPIQHAVVRNFVDLRGIRAAALYDADKDCPVRKSHENPAIKKVYEEFFGEPGSHKAHEVLHTSYVARKSTIFWLLELSLKQPFCMDRLRCVACHSPRSPVSLKCLQFLDNVVLWKQITACPILIIIEGEYI